MLRRGRAIFVAFTLALVVGAGGTSSAGAESGGALPVYSGTMNFPPIGSAADPEAYSWRVSLSPNQTLRLVSETLAEVEYPDGTVAFPIVAGKAHDAGQTPVPVSLEVSEGDVLTVVVHHLEKPYVYPVTSGEGSAWNGETTIIKGPPDEKEIEEAKRQAEEARRAAEEAERAAAVAPTPGPSVICTVPALHGLSLAVAKSRLRGAHCGIGQVHLAPGATAGRGKVVKQFRDAGIELAAGVPVAVKLGGR